MQKFPDLIFSSQKTVTKFTLVKRFYSDEFEEAAAVRHEVRILNFINNAMKTKEYDLDVTLR